MNDSSLQDAASGAVRFGWRIWKSDDDRDDRTAIELLALARLCTILGDPQAEALGRAVVSVEGSLDWTAADLISSLLAASFCLGVQDEAREDRLEASRYVRLLAELRMELPEGPERALLDLALRGGQHTDRTSAVLELAPSALRSGRTSDKEDVAARIEVTSLFGQWRVRVIPVLADLLDGAAIAAFKAYDLPLMMRLMRARAYLDAECPRVSPPARNMLLAAQNASGSFGDYDAAVATLVAQGERARSRHLRMAATIQALWTLAEVEEDHPPLLARAFAPARLGGSPAASLPC